MLTMKIVDGKKLRSSIREEDGDEDDEHPDPDVLTEVRFTETESNEEQEENKFQGALQE